MTTNSTEEYQQLLNYFKSQINEFELLGKQFFGKINSTHASQYQPSEVQADIGRLLKNLQNLEENARNLGLLGLMSAETSTDLSLPLIEKSIVSLTQETSQSVDVLFKQREQLIQSFQASIAAMSMAG